MDSNGVEPTILDASESSSEEGTSLGVSESLGAATTSREEESLGATASGEEESSGVTASGEESSSSLGAIGSKES
jgi:hypothetical protein